MIVEKTPEYTVAINGNIKTFKSPNANYIFNMNNGFTITWGKDRNEDPEFFPVPEILDLEITTKCTGGCPQCYKSNTCEGENMSFDTFKRIFDILPKSLTQIAFGADYDLSANPDIWKMMDYARKNNVIPNVTTVYVNDETADNLAKYCGAVAISLHPHLKDAFNICYDSIKRLTDRGMSQINIHAVLEEETYQDTFKIFRDRLTDPRLTKLNAIVCLSLKQKGRGINRKRLSQEKLNDLVKFAIDNNISIGFDTCSAKKAFTSFNNNPEVKNMIMACEASRESSYISAKGEYFPCSFCEGAEGWEEGINVLNLRNSEDFINNIWNNPRTVEFRENLINSVCNGCRSCPIYDI